MNKLAKSEQDVPTPPDSDVTDAQMDAYFRENRDAINAKLQEAMDDIARGDVSPMEPLSELLKAARLYHKART